MQDINAYPNKLKEFFKKHQLIKLSPKKVLLKPGRRLDYIYFIKDGEIKKYTHSYKKDEIILHVYKAGSFLPVPDSLGLKLTNHFYYTAVNEVNAYKIPTKKVVNFIEKNPDVAVVLAKKLYFALDEFLVRAITMMAGNALDKVVYELYCELNHYHQGKTNNVLINTNEKIIASKTGLSRETVNRVIRKLKDIGCVEVDRGSMIIKDPSKLKNWVYKEIIR